jgi:hypothetical protein
MIILFLLLSRLGFPGDYEISEKRDKDENFIFYNIKQNDDTVTVCLIDSEKDFQFYSEESDPKPFANIEDNIRFLAKKKGLGQVNCLILADLSGVKSPGLQFNFSYFRESIGVIFLAPTYLKKAKIINPENLANRFFIELTINNKIFYCLIDFKTAVKKDYAKKIIKNIAIFEKMNFNLVPINNFPIKLVSYNNKRASTIYESKKGHRKYSCLYLSTLN